VCDDVLDLFDCEGIDFHEPLAQLGHEAAADAEGHGAVGVVALRDDLWIEVFHHLHHGVHHGEFEGEGDVVVDGTLDDLCVLEGFDGCLTIGNDEARGAEFDATEVADNDDEDVGQPVGVDLPEDGLASRARRFAVVVGAEVGALSSKHIGIAGMASVVVALLILGHIGLHLVDGLDGDGKRKELTSFLGVSSFCDACYGFKAVEHSFWG